MKETYNHGIIIEYLLLLKDNKRTKNNLDEFKEKHKEDVETYWWDEKRKQILEKIPKHLENGNMVWCRMGSVVDIATPCKDIESCKFKSYREDTINGCSRCQNFQVTRFANNWNEASHIDWRR